MVVCVSLPGATCAELACKESRQCTNWVTFLWNRCSLVGCVMTGTGWILFHVLLSVTPWCTTWTISPLLDIISRERLPHVIVFTHNSFKVIRTRPTQPNPKLRSRVDVVQFICVHLRRLTWVTNFTVKQFKKPYLLSTIFPKCFHSLLLRWFVVTIIRSAQLG